MTIWDEWADANGELGPGLRPAMALLADAATAAPSTRSAISSRDIKRQSGFAPADRHRLEPGRRAEDGAAALPLPVPVLRRGRQAVLPALSALRGHLPRRAVQHRLLRAADADGGAGDGARSRASSSTRSATRISISTIWSRRSEQLARKPYPLPTMQLNPAVKDIFDFKYEDFTLENYQAHPHIKAEVAV